MVILKNKNKLVKNLYKILQYSQFLKVMQTHVVSRKL